MGTCRSVSSLFGRAFQHAAGLLLPKAPVFLFSLFLAAMGRCFEFKKKNKHPEGALKTNSSNSVLCSVL